MGQTGFPSISHYAPDFMVEIEGLELDEKSRGDVVELKVVMDIENMTSFDLTINNWDDKELGFKYTDARLSDRGGPSNLRIFEVGNRVKILMGYAAGQEASSAGGRPDPGSAERRYPRHLKYMVSGHIMSVSPRFPESGQPTISIGGVDSMVKLCDRHPTDGDPKDYRNKADWQIAQEIAERNHMSCRVTQEGEVHRHVVQKNQDDATFLKERAKRIEFECYFYLDPETGQEALNFVKPKDIHSGGAVRVYTFTWGQDLISFNPTLSMRNQVSKVTVQGWDPRTKERIRETATLDDLPGHDDKKTSGPSAVEKSQPGKEEVIVDEPVHSREEARKLAVARLRERAFEFITGSGQVIGQPNMRPGDNIELKGLGTRFSGIYYVTKVEHTLGSSGYLTQFEVKSPNDGGSP